MVKWPFLSLIINRCASWALMPARASGGYRLLEPRSAPRASVGRPGQQQLPSAGWSRLSQLTGKALDTLPDALQTRVLLQARGAQLCSVWDQQQGRQAALLHSAKWWRCLGEGARAGGRASVHTQHSPRHTPAASAGPASLCWVYRRTSPGSPGVEEQEARASGALQDGSAARQVCGRLTLRQGCSTSCRTFSTT